MKLLFHELHVVMANEKCHGQQPGSPHAQGIKEHVD